MLLWAAHQLGGGFAPDRDGTHPLKRENGPRYLVLGSCWHRSCLGHRKQATAAGRWVDRWWFLRDEPVARWPVPVGWIPTPHAGDIWLWTGSGTAAGRNESSGAVERTIDEAASKFDVMSSGRTTVGGASQECRNGERSPKKERAR